MCSDDGINRTCGDAMCAANAKRFVDDGHRSLGCCLLGQRNNILAKNFGNIAYGFLSAGRTEVDCFTGINNGVSVGTTTRVAALSTLRLRQEIIDCLDNVAGIGR